MGACGALNFERLALEPGRTKVERLATERVNVLPYYDTRAIGRARHIQSYRTNKAL